MEFFKVSNQGGKYFEIRLFFPDRIGMLSAFTGLFACYGINIEECRSYAQDGDVLDVFKVQVQTLPDWKAFEADAKRYTQLIQQGKAEEVRAEMSGRIIDFVRSCGSAHAEKLYPVDLQIDNDSSREATIVDIRSQDTPAFLYELSNALSMMNLNIKRIEARTDKRAVRDRLWLTTASGVKITSDDSLRAIQWSVLLIKQISHVLPNVPDPSAVLKQTMLFGKEMLHRRDFSQILLMLKKSSALKAFGQVFGTSRYMWEEFIRLQSPSILNIMGNEKLLGERKKPEVMQLELDQALAGVEGFEKIKEILNDYKDRELFRIDLRHLLDKTSYIEETAEEFSDLAEVVVRTGHKIAYEEAARKHALPKVRRGAKSENAVFALGKFGGKEIGYASDVELLFVYTEDPKSSPARSRANYEFYHAMVRNFCSLIQSRSEGIFNIDLRLRPYGKDGPLACSIDLFEEYYRPGGKARNFERQALVKLRHVGGSDALGAKVAGLRDRFVYKGEPFDYADAFKLRKRQRKELVEPGTVNAKYSAGGLLDIEYLVQTLQIVHGSVYPEVRVSNTLEALTALYRKKVIDRERYEAIRKAYLFLRNLINALRIVRGNAKDLTIHDRKTREFTMLARRMGHTGSEELVGQAFQQECWNAMNVAERLYASQMRAQTGAGEEEHSKGAVSIKQEQKSWSGILEAQREDSGVMLEGAGFTDVRKALDRLQYIETTLDSVSKKAFQRLLGQSVSAWHAAGDPDMALYYLESFLLAHPKPATLLEAVLNKPQNPGVLLACLGSGRYLPEILTLNPEYISWVLDPAKLTAGASLKVLEKIPAKPDPEKLLELRRRETLRLALAEMSGNSTVDEVYRVFSRLADAVVGKLLEREISKTGLCILGLGKLGGQELNFSSDLDLLFLHGTGKRPVADDVIRSFVASVAGRGPESAYYRVDLRLRPYGDMGSLVLAENDYLEYYGKGADAWEYQALLKARPVAGNLAAGKKLLRRLSPLLYRQSWDQAIVDRWRTVKRRYEAEVRRKDAYGTDVKLGFGGIRDVEFTVQFTQLMNAFRYPVLRNTNTLDALAEIRTLELLSEEDCETLRGGYLFLRRIENRIHLYENRQQFNIPSDNKRFAALARGLGYGGQAGRSAGEAFLADLQRVKDGCRSIFRRVFYGE